MARAFIEGRDAEGDGERTIDVDCAHILAAMIASARERGDARSFAHVMDVALELPLFTAADLAEHFDVAPSTISKWRSSDNAPQDVLREVVMDELCATLGVLGGD